MTSVLKSKKLSAIVQKCKDIPGKELFQYYDENGETRSVDSGMVNEYIKKISGGDFTAKDFRTWAGTVKIFWLLKNWAFAKQLPNQKKILWKHWIRYQNIWEIPELFAKNIMYILLSFRCMRTKAWKNTSQQLDDIEGMIIKSRTYE